MFKFVSYYCLFCVSICCFAETNVSHSLIANSGIDPAVNKLPKMSGVAMHGKCKYGPSFSHFALVNPKATKGGVLKIATVGASFTTLNPFCPEQTCAPHMIPMTFDTLMARSPDEPFSLYGLIAQWIQMPGDRSYLIIHINPNAKFHNNLPITSKDVISSYKTLAKYGPPSRRNLAKQVEKVTELNPLTVRFDFFPKEDGMYDRELPLIILIMPVFSWDDLQNKDFTKTGLTPLMSSGPYKVGNVEPGKSISYIANPQYWAKDLPVNKGRFNIEKIIVDVFHNDDAAFEAFKSGLVDFWAETNPLRWHRSYNFPALNDGRVRKVEIAHGRPVGMYGIALNTNNDALKNALIREAVILSFDPKEIQPQMDKDCQFTKSFFQNSEFQAKAEPSILEKDIISQLPTPVPFSLPINPFQMNSAERRQKALDLFKKAGCTMKNDQLFYQGKPLIFTAISAKRDQIKLLQGLERSLKKLGIGMCVLQLDETQYTKRVNDREYDMAMYLWGHTLSPGVEQKLYWHSKSADTVGSRNYANIRDANIDALCDQFILMADNREKLVASLQVLDRVLQQGHYIAPLFHRTKDYFAFWNRIQAPAMEEHSPYYTGIETFWVDTSVNVGH